MTDVRIGFIIAALCIVGIVLLSKALIKRYSAENGQSPEYKEEKKREEEEQKKRKEQAQLMLHFQDECANAHKPYRVQHHGPTKHGG